MVGSDEISEIGAERPTFFRNLKAVTFGECNIWDETTGGPGPRLVTSPTVGSSLPFGTSSVRTASPNFAQKMIFLRKASKISTSGGLEKQRGLTGSHLRSKLAPETNLPKPPCGPVWPLVWYWNHLPAPADHPWGYSGVGRVMVNFQEETKDIFTNQHPSLKVKGNGEG